MKKLETDKSTYNRVNERYKKMIANSEGKKVPNFIERIGDHIESYGDLGGKILGLGLAKATKLIYLDLRNLFKHD